MGAQNLATVQMIQLLQEKIAQLLNAPKIVIRDDEIDPASIYGGTWTKIQGRFLLASGGGGTY